jgi:hypothetical protein
LWVLTSSIIFVSVGCGKADNIFCLRSLGNYFIYINLRVNYFIYPNVRANCFSFHNKRAIYFIYSNVRANFFCLLQCMNQLYGYPLCESKLFYLP